MIIDTFDVMLEECVRRPLVMGIALHPYLMGYPHRLKHLERALRHVLERADERAWVTTASAVNARFRDLGL